MAWRRPNTWMDRYPALLWAFAFDPGGNRFNMDHRTTYDHVVNLVAVGNDQKGRPTAPANGFAWKIDGVPNATITPSTDTVKAVVTVPQPGKVTVTCTFTPTGLSNVSTIDFQPLPPVKLDVQLDATPAK
jgi:hypothetical protein